MRVRSLKAVGWRNLAPLELAPSAGLSVLLGDNGQGKTNVVEALYFLSTLRSFRTSRLPELVQRGATECTLEASLEVGGLERQVRVQLSLGVQGTKTVRRTWLDGKGVTAAGLLGAGLRAVLFVPEDLLLPRGAPAARRRFLDLAVFGVERRFFQEAAAFKRVLKSRNALLRQPGSLDLLLLEAYDEQLAQTGARLVVRRRALVAALDPWFRQFLQGLGEERPGELRYTSAAAVEEARGEGEVRQALAEGLRQHRRLDLIRKQSTFGPQGDDLEIHLGGRPAREHASQGQLRSLVLALKLAEFFNLNEALGEPPVLLLDDVASELDAGRRRQLSEIVTGLQGQTIATMTDGELLPRLPGRRDWRLSDGKADAISLYSGGAGC